VRWPALLARHGHSLKGVLQDTFAGILSSSRRDTAHSALGSSQTGIPCPALPVSLNLFPLPPLAFMPLHHIQFALAVLKIYSAPCETTDGNPVQTMLPNCAARPTGIARLARAHACAAARGMLRYSRLQCSPETPPGRPSARVYERAAGAIPSHHALREAVAPAGCAVSHWGRAQNWGWPGGRLVCSLVSGGTDDCSGERSVLFRLHAP